jgi:hypothetical protein
MRVSVIHRLSVVCVAAAALTASANASANSRAIIWKPNMPSHIPGQSTGYGPADQGGALMMMMSDMNSDCANFVTHEMWYGVEGTGTYYVEVGFTNGIVDNGCIFSSAFWADFRNGGGYHLHIQNIPLQYWTRYEPLVQFTTDWCTLNVWLGIPDGNGWNFLATSGQNCAGSGRYLAAGIETTGLAAAENVHGWTWNWERQDNFGQWQWGWDTPTLVGVGSSPGIRWYTPAGCGQCETEEELNEPFSF